MLELRPGCEHCNRSLAPDSTEAMICSFECTFCRSCVEDTLENVCPNCGGGLVARPIRPANDLKGGNFLGNHAATEKVTHRPLDVEKHQAFAKSIKDIAPENR